MMIDNEDRERLSRIEATQAAHSEQLAAIKANQADIKTTLGQVMQVLIKLTSDVAEIKGRATDTPHRQRIWRTARAG